MFFPTTLKKEKKQNIMDLPDIMLNKGTHNIHFTNTFKYLGSIINSDLTKDAEIEARINKASSHMGIIKHFFNCRDGDRCIKYWIFISGPLNTLLWGAESWIISEKNKNHLHAFYHSAIQRILSLRWEQVKEQHITNEHIKVDFKHIPPINAFITKRIWTYIGKTFWDKNANSFLKTHY